MSTTDDPVVTLLPSGRQFVCHPNASILESGLSAGVALPFRCHNGSCGECRARVVSGEVETSRFHDYALTEAEKAWLKTAGNDARMQKMLVDGHWITQTASSAGAFAAT